MPPRAATTRKASTLPASAVQPASRAAWRRWLAKHHARDTGVWFVYYKKASGKATLGYDDMIEEALCVGWVDGVARALDEERAMLWLSPRRAKSVWSKPNKARVKRLVAAGLMQRAGLAKVARAKADGSWSAMDSVDRLEVPDDLARALAATPAARHFDAFPASVKKGILEWIRQAKRPETRAARIARAARHVAENLRPAQWPKQHAG